MNANNNPKDKESSTNNPYRISVYVSLIHSLLVREWRSKYRRSVLGPLWAIIQPLSIMIIFLFLRNILDISSKKNISSALMLFCPLTLWTFFSNAVTKSGPSIYTNTPILKKIPIRREIFPLTGILITLVDFFIAFILLLIVMIACKTTFGISIILLPIIVLLTGLLAMGVGLFIASIGTYKRDIIMIIPYVMQFWLLATPILYPLSNVTASTNKFRALFYLNPMVGLIDSFNKILLFNSWPDFSLLGISCLLIGAIWIIAWPSKMIASASTSSWLMAASGTTEVLQVCA